VASTQPQGTIKKADISKNTALYVVPDALPLVYFADTVKYISIPKRQGGIFYQLDHLRETKSSPKEELMVFDMPQDFAKMTEKAKIISYYNTPDKISAQAVLEEPGILVFSMIHYNGWKAYAAKKPVDIYRGNKVFPTLFLNPGTYTGENRVFLVYRPVSFIFGLFLTLFICITAPFYLLINNYLKKAQ
jgi:hypothetical protein